MRSRRERGADVSGRRERGPRARRPARDRARRGGDARVHAGRDAGDRQGAVVGRHRAPGRAHHPGQHLSPGAAAGRGAGRVVRRPAQVHELAARDPDRLGRLPGVQPARSADRRRRRRHVSLAHRRQRAAPDARARDGDPDGAGQRHRDGVRRMPAVGRAARRDRSGDGAHDALGAHLRGRAGRAGPAPLRDRAGRRARRPAARAPGRDRGAAVRRARAGRPGRRRGARRSCTA